MMETLYENAGFQQLTEGAMRPGGLALTRQVLAACALAPGSRVLDAGCGLGATMALMERLGLRPAGIDGSPGILKKAAASHPHMDMRLGSADALPWKDGAFAGVLCECSFSLFSHPGGALSEFRRVLAPGGRLAISDFYSREEQAGGYPSGTCLGGAVPPKAQRGLLENAGFACLCWTDATDHLRQFTARMVWEYGSASAFWRAMLPGACAGGGTPAKGPRLGYAWSIWERKGGGADG